MSRAARLRRLMGAFLLSLMVILSVAYGGGGGEKKDEEKKDEEKKDEEKKDEEKK
jgi:hypothetical protein